LTGTRPQTKRLEKLSNGTVQDQDFLKNKSGTRPRRDCVSPDFLIFCEKPGPRLLETKKNRKRIFVIKNGTRTVGDQESSDLV
jgi:hypothetical protein